MVALNPLACEILYESGQQPAAEHLEIGGGVALWTYLPARSTNDVDAWWAEPSREGREAITIVMERTAARHGLDCSHRGQAGYESWDLRRGGKTVFAFQVAVKISWTSPPS